VSIVGPDADLAALLSVQQLGFGGAAQVDPGAVEVLRCRVMAGTTRVAVGGDSAPVCVGMHQPIGPVSEVVGVATLPAQRRRGWAGRVTQALVADARELGVDTVFLCAADESVADGYRRVGFRQVGLVCAAEVH
jgi:ribosomal protein S18 acetylase RimI-like enzyme